MSRPCYRNLDRPFEVFLGLGPVELDENFHMPWDLVPMLLARLSDPLEFPPFLPGHSQRTKEAEGRAALTVVRTDPALSCATTCAR